MGGNKIKGERMITVDDAGDISDEMERELQRLKVKAGPGKVAFRKCMTRLYGEHPVQAGQLADLARVFFMGWVEAAFQYAGEEGFDIRIKSMAEANQVVELDWVPDDSWKWWIPEGDHAAGIK